MRHYQHFGLEGPLFKVVTPLQPLYMSAPHREAFAALERGLRHEPSAFMLLIGEPGVGKTTLLRALLARDYDQIRTASISKPKLSFDDLLREALRQFGVGAGPSRNELLAALGRFLGTVEPGGRATIVIDEAHALEDRAFDELRLLSDRNNAGHSQLHVILVGQRELARRLIEPGLESLNDQIGERAVLDRMSRAEAYGYVEYCMRAGGRGARQVFGHRALARIVDHGGGVPRRLNMLCHNAMLLAYSANRRKVNLRAARTAAAQYQGAA
jgi:general secretion pathway protein A